MALASSSGSLAAVNNTFYTASAIYGKGQSIGKGYVVYNGLDSTATVTGLQPNTSYYITGAEYNSDANFIAYNTKGTSITTSTRDGSATVMPLPVKLVSFTGIVDAFDIATLQWTTATEYNNAYFALERSQDGLMFTEVARRLANGNSLLPQHYTQKDSSPLTTLTYYRLKQVDQDGSTSYSGVISLSPHQDKNANIEVYPNPGTAESIKIECYTIDNQPIHISIIDNTGRIVASKIQEQSVGHLSSIASNTQLAAGVYTVTIHTGTSSIRKRVTILN